MGNDLDEPQDDAQRLLRRSVVTLAFVAFVAWVVQFIEIETVLATGPLLACTAVVVAVTGVRARNRPAKLVAAFVLSVVFALFWGVMFFDWSPRRAVEPFAIVGTLSMGVVLALTRRAYEASLERPAPVVLPTSTLLPVPVPERTPEPVTGATRP